MPESTSPEKKKALELTKEQVMSQVKKVLKNPEAIAGFEGNILSDPRVSASYKKDRNTLDVMMEIMENIHAPIVDDKLKLIFMIPNNRHDSINRALDKVHMLEDGVKERDERGDRTFNYFLASGYGYYISSADPYFVVTSEKYKAKREDKDVFNFYERVDRY